LLPIPATPLPQGLKPGGDELQAEYPQPVADFIIDWETTNPTGTLFILHLRDSCARSWVGTDPAQYEAVFRGHMRELSLQLAFITQRCWEKPGTAELVVPTITYTLQIGAGGV
jgi:hypothetical protein